MATDSLSSDHLPIDEEITNLKKRAQQLRADIRTHVSTICSAYSADQFPSDLLEAVNQQEAHAQESLWRIGATVTAFKVQDPDPRAVDGGAVLGIRFEILRSGRFLQPYVVLLNRPYRGEASSGKAANPTAEAYLRVHRHTIPNCIPLGGLAARYLPPPTVTAPIGDEDAPAKPRSQNLSLFVRDLRQRLVAYHNRLGAVADMRRAAELGAGPKRKRRRKEKEDQAATVEDREAPPEEDGDREDGSDDSSPPRIVEISLADAEAKQVKIDWSNGDICRLVMDAGGEIEKCVMYTARGRDMPAAQEFLQRITRVERVPEMIRRKRGLEPA